MKISNAFQNDLYVAVKQLLENKGEKIYLAHPFTGIAVQKTEPQEGNFDKKSFSEILGKDTSDEYFYVVYENLMGK